MIFLTELVAGVPKGDQNFGYVCIFNYFLGVIFSLWAHRTWLDLCWFKPITHFKGIQWANAVSTNHWFALCASKDPSKLIVIGGVWWAKSTLDFYVLDSKLSCYNSWLLCPPGSFECFNPTLRDQTSPVTFFIIKKYLKKHRGDWEPLIVTTAGVQTQSGTEKSGISPIPERYRGHGDGLTLHLLPKK